MTKVAGFDLAMTATGAAHTVEGMACTHLIRPRALKDARLPEIKTRVRELVADAEFVLLEMLPPNMKGAGITGMVQGVVRDMLQDLGIPYGDLGPSTLKKFATGRGNASKTDMAVAAFKRGGVEFTNDNECDGWWLYVAATFYVGDPLFVLPQIQVAELKNIQVRS